MKVSKTNPSMQALEGRVRRLERLNHLLIISCVALASVPILLGAGGQGTRPPAIQVPPGQLSPLAPLPPSAQKYLSKQIQEMLAAERQVHNVLRTRALALVDREGKTKAVLSTNESNDPVLTMYGLRDGGRSTAVSLSLGLSANQPECVFYGYDEKVRAGLYASGEGRQQLPTMLFAPGGQILMKHSNGNSIVDLTSSGESAVFDVNDASGKNVVRLRSGGPATSRITEFLLTASQSNNTARIFAGPSMVAVGVASAGTKYHSQMAAEGTQGTIKSRSKNGPQDQVFSSKWRSPLHDVHSWQVNPDDPF